MPSLFVHYLLVNDMKIANTALDHQQQCRHPDQCLTSDDRIEHQQQADHQADCAKDSSAPALSLEGSDQRRDSDQHAEDPQDDRHHCGNSDRAGHGVLEHEQACSDADHPAEQFPSPVRLIDENPQQGEDAPDEPGQPDQQHDHGQGGAGPGEQQDAKNQGNDAPKEQEIAIALVVYPLECLLILNSMRDGPATLSGRTGYRSITRAEKFLDCICSDII